MWFPFYIEPSSVLVIDITCRIYWIRVDEDYKSYKIIENVAIASLNKDFVYFRQHKNKNNAYITYIS